MHVSYKIRQLAELNIQGRELTNSPAEGQEIAITAMDNTGCAVLDDEKHSALQLKGIFAFTATAENGSHNTLVIASVGGMVNVAQTQQEVEQMLDLAMQLRQAGGSGQELASAYNISDGAHAANEQFYIELKKLEAAAPAGP